MMDCLYLKLEFVKKNKNNGMHYLHLDLKKLIMYFAKLKRFHLFTLLIRTHLVITYANADAVLWDVGKPKKLRT